MTTPLDASCPTPQPLRSVYGPLIFLNLLFFLGFMARIVFAPLMPVLEPAVHMTHGQAGWLFLMISLGFFAGQGGSGLVSARFHHKGALPFSAAGAALSPLLWGFSGNAGRFHRESPCLGAVMFPAPGATAFLHLREQEETGC